jgi:hypothetical protein
MPRMNTALQLKKISGVLAYTCFCDSAGTVSVSKTKQELLDDCTAQQLLDSKQIIERATTAEAWLALNTKFECVAIQGTYARIMLTVKFETGSDEFQLTIAGKSLGYSYAQVEVRLKK